MSDVKSAPSAADAGTIKIGERRVNRLGFGAMRLCGPGVWGPPADPQNAIEVLKRAVALGVNFIDTANAYGPNVNEEQIAEALYPYPADLVIATKGGSTRSGPGQWGRDCRPAELNKACEGSLRRLRVDCIELYQLHAVDPTLPYAEQIGALRELQTQGKIKHIGVSNVNEAQLETARSVATIVSVQNRYNAMYRDSEQVLENCERDGIVFIPWFPLEAGDIPQMRVLNEIAQEKNVTPHQIAIAWLLERSPMMLPIPGTSSLPHLEENVAAAAITLTQDDCNRIATAAEA
ncbi:MAG: aldo/keto reductase [Candidatus Eremiobacteraeota bacterium]|nr:aldo/keto reductase [Candidatus Eremiobacteraeota bacterium]